jgi:hypothetical protein
MGIPDYALCSDIEETGRRVRHGEFGMVPIHGEIQAMRIETDGGMQERSPVA